MEEEYFEGTVRAVTDKAVLINFSYDQDQEAWIPFSEIIDSYNDMKHAKVTETGNESGDDVYVTIPRWLAEDRGLV